MLLVSTISTSNDMWAAPKVGILKVDKLLYISIPQVPSIIDLKKLIPSVFSTPIIGPI